MAYSRELLLGIFALAVCGILAIAFWPEKPEPVYKGTKLSEWLGSARGGRWNSDALDAFEAIGTNGIPFYLDWIAYEPGLLKKLEIRLAEKGRRWFPKWVPQDKLAIRAFGSFQALRKLAERGEPAIPRLVTYAINLDRSPAERVWRLYGGEDAAQLLVNIGIPAVPAYLTLMTNNNPRVRALAIRQSANFDRRTAIFAQLRKSLQDPDYEVRAAATNALWPPIRIPGRVVP